MPFFVYIHFSASHDRYYIGQTNDLSDRLHRHNAGSEKATAPFLPYTLVWHAENSSRAEAMILERKLKNLSPQRLKLFIEKYQKR